MTSFNAETCAAIFGAEDAENEQEDRFKQYFYKNRAYEDLGNELPIRIVVGHKGVGKSALLKKCHLDANEANSVAIWLRPDDVYELRFPDRQQDLNQQIEAWKTGLLRIIAKQTIEAVTTRTVEDDTQLARTTAKNLLGLVSNILRTTKREQAENIEGALFDSFMSDQKIFVFIDDIDRGWSASPQDIKNISALLNAVRDIAGVDRRLKFRIGLRSDVYYLVRTSDESTDKIESNIVWLEWTNDEILRVLAKRISTHFELNLPDHQIRRLSQKQIDNEILSKVIERKYTVGRGHWANQPIHNVLLSLTRKRPRDLVKLFYGAARIARQNDHSIITSQDLESSFSNYSLERLQDISNEFKSELPEIDTLLRQMRPTTKKSKTSESFQYSTDELIKKLKNILENNSLRFTNGRAVTANALIQFLYKIDFVTARKERNGEIQRKHFDQNQILANDPSIFGFDWEVHPAYRWALQPSDIHAILDEVSH